MTKPTPAKIDDLSVLLTFPDSITGEAAIAELELRLRASEAGRTAHKALRDHAALKSDAALAKHDEETSVFDRAVTRLSVAIGHARKRLAEVQQAEREKAGANARTEALALAQEGDALLRELLDQAKLIGARLARWNALEAEVSRLNGIAVAGGAERVAMPTLPDDAEAAADTAAEITPELGKFLKDRSHEVWSRKRGAQRAAEAEARKKAQTATEEEANALRKEGFDPDLLSREPRGADEGYQMTLLQQRIREMRGLGFAHLTMR